MSRYELLLDKIKIGGVWVPEVLCRKYLAETPDDVRVWHLLFNILHRTKNYNELLLLINKLLSANFFNASYLSLCIKYALLCGDYSLARKLCLNIDAENADKNLNIDNDLYHVCLLERIACGNKIGKIPFMPRVMYKAAIEFNDKSVESIRNSSLQVVCYIRRDFHYVIQAEIASELLSRGISVVFSNCLWFINAVKPKVLLISEALYENLQELRSSSPDTLIVNTRHGLGDKNHAALGASQSDRICVSSDSIARVMIDEMLISPDKIWVTGYPQMDSYFEKTELKFNKTSDSSIKTIIFAPTFNPSLSAAYCLKNDLVKNVRGDNENIRIIVKPHPHLLRDEPEIIKNWISESKLHANVFIDIDPNSNLMGYFHKCDLMISDVSSAALAWFALNKPLICLIDPEVVESSPHFSPDGIEWQMHEASIVVTSPSDLAKAVSHALDNPHIKFDVRQRFKEYLFGNLQDGKSSHRVANKIIQHLTENNND